MSSARTAGVFPPWPKRCCCPPETGAHLPISSPICIAMRNASTEDPGRIEPEIRSIRRRQSAKRAIFRADRLIPVGALALAGTLLVMKPGLRPIGDRQRFGGGGVLVLRDSTGSSHAVRFRGNGPEDTARVRRGVPALSSPLEAPLLSPDGRRRLARCVPDGGGPPDVCVEAVDGRDRLPLSPSPGDDNPIGWSPDGRFALISSDRGSGGTYSYDLFAVDVTTGSVRRISDDPYQTDLGMWSPDGTRIAYRRNGPDSGAIVIADVLGRIMAAYEMPGAVGGPVWSPNGKRVAFAIVQPDGNSRIYVAEAPPDRESVRLVRNTDRMLSPFWSPDGRYIAAFRLRLDGMSRRRLGFCLLRTPRISRSPRSEEADSTRGSRPTRRRTLIES